MPFVPNLMIKPPIGLFKSCRGSADLQLSYLPQGALQLKKFEKNLIRVCQSERFLPLGVPERAVARHPRRGTLWARTPRPATVRWIVRRGTARAEPPSRPSPLAPRTTRARVASRRPCRRPPTHVATVPHTHVVDLT
jgi:hypothetical protein